MKFDIKKHIYLILLFILSFTVETAQSQEVTNIHIAATDTVPTYTSDSAVINFLKDAGIPITQNSKLKLLKSGRAKFIDLFDARSGTQYSYHIRIHHPSSSEVRAWKARMPPKASSSSVINPVFLRFRAATSEAYRLTYC